MTGRDVEKRCKGVVDMDMVERAKRGELTEEDVERILNMLPSGVPKDVFRKLFDAAKEIRNKGVSDILEGLAVTLTVLTGRPVTKEMLQPAAGVAELINCVNIEEEDISIDGECIERNVAERNIPRELVDQFVAATSIGNIIKNVV
jgi:hypothetical protein